MCRSVCGVFLIGCTYWCAAVPASAQFPGDPCVESPTDALRCLTTTTLCGADGQRGRGYNDENLNLKPARILSRMDMDRDGLPDNSPDSDGDGLPDNWEIGGRENVADPSNETECNEADRLVRFPAPLPMVPGTPPTPVFTRLAVATNALDHDTDDDGLSDFIEVFGLKFIDENGNGRLDLNEWEDLNGDGMPSPGEWPLDNSTDSPENPATGELLHDFDGFVFTDPSNPDTDGDGIFDGEDPDPLLNPRSFGLSGNLLLTPGSEGDQDKDNDGLGNGMDMGNDLRAGDAGVVQFTREHIDNPLDLRRLIELFRPDLEEANQMPESLIEDLLGLDWNGDGLWRTTDIREWSMVVPLPESQGAPRDDLFRIENAAVGGGDHYLYAPRTFDELAAAFALEANANDQYHGTGLGLGWQRQLEPPAASPFMPDRRVYGVLYAWRVPGFDIDGDGFVGAPTLSATSTHSCGDSRCRTVALLPDGTLTDSFPVSGSGEEPLRAHFDDFIDIAEPASTGPVVDGIIEPLVCGRGAAQAFIPILGFLWLGLTVRRRA